MRAKFHYVTEGTILGPIDIDAEEESSEKWTDGYVGNSASYPIPRRFERWSVSMRRVGSAPARNSSESTLIVR